MRIKLLFLEQNIFRFANFLSMIHKNSSGGAQGVIMTITRQHIAAIYDYNDLTTDIQVIDFSNADSDNFAYSYFSYDLNLIPVDKKVQTIDEVVLCNGLLNGSPIEEVTIRFSLEHLKEMILLSNDKKSKSLCIKAINNTNKADPIKTLFDVHVVMEDKIEKTTIFPFRSRVNSVTLHAVDHGAELIEFNHFLSIIKNVNYKATKKGIKVIMLHFKKEYDVFNLVYQFDKKSYKSVSFNAQDVACYSSDDTLEKTYAVLVNSLGRVFPGNVIEEYLFNEELFLSEEYLTMKLSCAYAGKERKEQSEAYSHAMSTIRIKELDGDEDIESNDIDINN